MKKIALAQMNIEYGNFQRNVAVASQMIDSAADKGCDLILLPELWSTGFDYKHVQDSSNHNADLILYLQTISDMKNLSICGSYIEQLKGAFFNSAVLIQPNQSPMRYQKVHLFRLMHEDSHFSPGTLCIPFQSVLGNVGLAICFDLRFPELFLNLANQGAETFLMMAHWPLSRIRHWDILLQSRAIENQTYFCAVNSCGQSGKDIFGGHSAVISPDGEVILRGSNDEELLVAEIDPSLPATTRNKFMIKR